MKGIAILLQRTVAARRVAMPAAWRQWRTFSAAFQVPSREDCTAFCDIVGEKYVVQDPEVLEIRNTDWTKRYHGGATVLLQPDCVEQVAEILRYCQNHNIAVVPQGGNTGLVGGSVPRNNNEIILSLERMNKIQNMDENTGILQCQAGCVLQALQDYARERNHLVPIDLGAKGTCQIGGNLSTNAGGQFYYRYGSLAGNVIGVQSVMADGRILDLNYSRPNLKDNTGYKIHQMFLGAEGTLGIITAVALLCPTHPSSQQAVLLACETYDQVLHVLRTAKMQLGEILAALEFMDSSIIEVVQKDHSIPLVRDNGDVYPFYLLVETHGSSAEHDQEKMETFLTNMLEDQHVVDGALAQDETQRAYFWTLRESTNPSFGSLGYGYKYDVSVPVAQWVDFVEETRQHLKQGLPSELSWLQVNWGHILDGNIHWNLTTPDCYTLDERIKEHLEPFLFDAVLKRGGSISAEHGLGQAKNKVLTKVHDDATLRTMRELKHLWDPTGILNPGKVLPSEPNNS